MAQDPWRLVGPRLCPGEERFREPLLLGRRAPWIERVAHSRDISFYPCRNSLRALTAERERGEYIDCPERGEPLVIEEDEGRKLAFCYRHVIACYVGKGWDKEKANRE